MKSKTVNKAIILFIALLIATAGEIGMRFASPKPQRTAPYEVVRVVDGDTIIIDMDGVNERVRFIGLDAPESVHADETKNTEEGRLASEFTKEMLEGQMVTLEFDMQERDPFGRILAYVYLGDEMFNKTLIREGHADAITYPPNLRYQEEFRKIQQKRR